MQDDESRGGDGNLLNNVEDFENHFNGSNFDMQSMNGINSNYVQYTYPIANIGQEKGVYSNNFYGPHVLSGGRILSGS